MVESDPSVGKDEIDLLELIRTLLQAWKTIVGITIVCIGLAIAYALYLPEIYEAEILLAPAQEDETAASSLLNKFGGLVAIAGVKDRSDAFMSRVIGTLKSHSYLSEFIAKNNLLERVFHQKWDLEKNEWIIDADEQEPTILDGAKILSQNIFIEQEKETSLLRLKVLTNDANLSAMIANKVVDSINDKFMADAINQSMKRIEYLNEELVKTKLEEMRAVLFNLMQTEKQKAMISNIKKDSAFEIIDPAQIPSKPIRPNRQLLVSLGGVFGVILGIFLVLFTEFLRKSKSSFYSTSVE